MQWTKEAPKVAGWYWCSAASGSRPTIIELKDVFGRIEDRDGYYIEDFDFLWAGPVLSPEAWKIEHIPVSPVNPNRARRDAAARNIGLGLAFVGYYHVGETIGALAVVPVLVEETEKSYNAGFEAGIMSVVERP